MFNLELSKDYNIIKECFAKDEDLINKWHIESGKGLDSCANRTINDIKDFIGFKFFIVKDEQELVGFFGIEKSIFLSTFFVSPKYRKKEYMKEYWELVKINLKPTFYSSIYSKNIPAKDFFIKNNGKLLKESNYMGNSILVFEFKGE